MQSSHPYSVSGLGKYAENAELTFVLNTVAQVFISPGRPIPWPGDQKVLSVLSTSELGNEACLFFDCTMQLSKIVAQHMPWCPSTNLAVTRTIWCFLHQATMKKPYVNKSVRQHWISSIMPMLPGRLSCHHTNSITRREIKMSTCPATTYTQTWGGPFVNYKGEHYSALIQVERLQSESKISSYAKASFPYDSIIAASSMAVWYQLEFIESKWNDSPCYTFGHFSFISGIRTHSIYRYRRMFEPPRPPTTTTTTTTTPPPPPTPPTPPPHTHTIFAPAPHYANGYLFSAHPATPFAHPAPLSAYFCYHLERLLAEFKQGPIPMPTQFPHCSTTLADFFFISYSCVMSLVECLTQNLGAICTASWLFGRWLLFTCVMTKCMDFQFTISTVAFTTLAAFEFFFAWIERWWDRLTFLVNDLLHTSQWYISVLDSIDAYCVSPPYRMGIPPQIIRWIWYIW